jgi:flavin reductase (DIM6/NTAB) family NADH-FMN oxidoreductase RutF
MLTRFTSLEASDYRRLMGFWATGVSVVTAEGSEGPAGATANAFTSLSLSPPLALVCFDVTSRTLQAVRESKLFCVNMLSTAQEDVSRLFATKRSQKEKFALADHRLEYGAPVLEGSVAWLVCALDTEIQRGDHVIALGEVLGGAVDEDASPLLFHRGTYVSLHQESEVV